MGNIDCTYVSGASPKRGEHGDPGIMRWYGLLQAIGIVILVASLSAFIPGHHLQAAESGNAARANLLLPVRSAEPVESLTQRHLHAIESRLRSELGNEHVPISELWRRKLTVLSMSGPLAGVTRSTLETLGDNAFARNALFFALPVVRWITSPFLFPLEIDGSRARQNQEVDRLLAFISDQKTRGLAATIDNVGDASLTAGSAASYRKFYLTLIDRFARTGKGGELSLSLKLSALTNDLDAALGDDTSGQAKRREIRGALRELLVAAAAHPERRIFLRIDMEEHAYKDLTLRLFREVVDENPELARMPDGSLRIGVVIQAYLRESARDVTTLAGWARSGGFRVPIRLVKGAYLEHERESAKRGGRKPPVWDNKSSTDANYEAIAAWMMAHREMVAPVFATHNIRTISFVMALGDHFGVSPDGIEIQMLRGMGDPIKRVVVRMGYHLREYVPAGTLERGLKYAGRRFQELASGDNALTRTLHGDFSGVDGRTPQFTGARDLDDSRSALMILGQPLPVLGTRAGGAVQHP